MEITLLYGYFYGDDFVWKIMLWFINLIPFKKEFIKNEIAKAS